MVSYDLGSNSWSATLPIEHAIKYRTHHTFIKYNILFIALCTTGFFKQIKKIVTENNYYVILIPYFIKCKWTLLVIMNMPHVIH